MESIEHLVQSMQFVFGRDPMDNSFFKSFKPGGWYSDRVIDTWGNYLMKMYKPAGTYWVTSYWIKRQVSLLTSFNAVECNESLFGYTLLSDNLWNSFQLSECKVLFIPVNKKNEHWILIVLCNLHNLKVEDNHFINLYIYIYINQNNDMIAIRRF
jgi:Ulp1 family protease